MRVTAIWNSKGGVGKTTTTINLAYIYSLKGNRVLVIDNDPQTNTTPHFRKANEQGCTIRNLYENPENIKKCIYRTKFKGIDIIKGSTFLTEEDANASDYLLMKALWPVKDNYDIVLIDCRPSYEGLTRNAIMAADTLLTPIVLDGYCRDNLNLVERIYWQLQGDDGTGESEHIMEWFVFANKVCTQKSQKEIYRDLVEKQDFPLLETCVTSRAAVMSANVIRKPLLKHRSKDCATNDFIELAERLEANWIGKV